MGRAGSIRVVPGNIGPLEIAIVLVIVLIIFGAGKLPEIGEGLGRGIRSFRKAIKQPDEIDITPKKDEAAAKPDGEKPQV